MFGPLEGIDPDSVENLVDNMLRTLYKTEKNFAENPSPKNMASTVGF